MTIRRTFLHSLFGVSKNGTKSTSLANRRAKFRPSNVASTNFQAGKTATTTTGPRRVRIRKIPPKVEANQPTVPKLPPAGPSLLPKPLKHASSGVGLTVGASAAGTASGEIGTAAQSFTQRAIDFLKLNGPVLLLNFGSLCTLAGFTRTDVLELRLGNLIGNCCGMTYFMINRLVPPFSWAAVFGLTNAYNIHLILEERSDKVTMTKDEQSLYEEHFLTHGVTPKQFRMILDKSEVVHVPKDQIIVRANQQLDSVYLVVSGRTEASILGRHLTYASSLPGNNVRQKGGDSGAWIGEIQFLESFWQKEQIQRRNTKSPMKNFLAQRRGDAEDAGGADTIDDIDDDEEDFDIDGYSAGRGGRALHTIICVEPAKLRKWKHEDLEDLLKTSNDMRSAMTRSLTASVVGKVVNFTISRGKERERGKYGSPTWSSWLNDGITPKSDAVEIKAVARKMTDAAESPENTKMDDKEADMAVVNERNAKPKAGITTREDAIEAFRRILLGEPGIGGNA